MCPPLNQNCRYEIKENKVTTDGESIPLWGNIDKIPASTPFL